jgi:acetyl esterase/lipase
MGKRYWIGMIAATALVAGSAATSGAREKFRDLARDRMAERMGADEGPKAPGSEAISYGSNALQSLDVWRAKDAKGPAPLVVFVHGGGWQHGSKDNATGRFKPVHYPGEGYAFASINYRLVPGATVEQQAADVAAAGQGAGRSRRQSGHRPAANCADGAQRGCASGRAGRNR